MPYKRQGKRVMVKKSAGYKTKAVAKTVDSAKKMTRLLKSKGH